jgi:hypothetical protein
MKKGGVITAFLVVIFIKQVQIHPDLHHIKDKPNLQGDH